MNLKACNRCGGDMILEDLLDEAELVCIQCGHRTFAPGQPRNPYEMILKDRKRTPEKRAA